MTRSSRSAWAVVALGAVCAGLLVATAGPARSEWERSSDTEIALEGDGVSWHVHATINGRVHGTFLLDTGATFCVLTPATAQRLGIVPGDRKVMLRTANGVVQAPLVDLASVEIGGTKAQGVQAVVQGGVGEADGIIGLSFLNRFSYAIVPARHVLRLH